MDGFSDDKERRRFNLQAKKKFKKVRKEKPIDDLEEDLNSSKRRWKQKYYEEYPDNEDYDYDEDF